MKRTVSLVLSLVLIVCALTAIVPDARAELRAPTITKEPGGENRSELGTALFVARADNASEIAWYLVAPRGASYDVNEVGDLFPGMSAAGQGTETLALYALASGINGWQVECRFKDLNGEETVSQRATITVDASLPAAPAITQAPQKAYLNFGEKTTLSVYAEAPAGYAVKYEWFSTETNNPANATLIADATTAEFVPPEKDGTVYYCAGLKSVGSESPVSSYAFTPLIPVTYSTEPEVPEHVHTYSETWDKDDIYHWHVCTGCGEIADRATHSYDWTETVKATSRKQGERVGVCSVCGYQTTQIIPVQASQRGAGKGLLVALLVLVIAMLLAGAYYYVRYYRTGTKPDISTLSGLLNSRKTSRGRSSGRASGQTRGRHSGGSRGDDDDEGGSF